MILDVNDWDKEFNLLLDVRLKKHLCNKLEEVFAAPYPVFDNRDEVKLLLIKWQTNIKEHETINTRANN